MHIHFKSISLQRFRSFNEQATLYFDDVGPGLYFLKGQNKTAISMGSNGSGKSSCIDALMWCLYGKTVQGLKNPDVLPWSGKGKTEVGVNLTIDETDYSVRRTISPNLLTINGKEVGQDYVNRLITIPFEIIPYTIILGQKQPLFFDLTASEKLKLFSETLNLERWELRSTQAADCVKSLENEIAKAESELEACLNAQQQALADFNSLKQQSVNWEANRAEQLSKGEETKDALQKQIDGVMNEHDTADLKYDRALTELKALKPTLEQHYKDLRKINENINFCENNLKNERRDKEKTESDLAALEHDTCPTCKQPFKSEQDRKQIQKTLKNALKSFTNGIEINQDNWDRNIVAANHTQVIIQNLEKAKEQFEQDAEESRDTLDRLLPQMERWKSEKSALERAIKDNENSNNPYAEQLQAMRRRKDQYKETAVQTQKSIQIKTQQCERTRFWVKGFKDIKLLQVEEILQELTIVTSGLLDEFGLINWSIKYDIERETKAKTITRGLNIVVLSPNNKHAVKWESWSGGEAQRLRLIGTLALSNVLLNHVGATTNLSIFDEPTVGLSKEGIQDLVELLAQLAKDTKKNIFLIDHHTILSNKFVQTILVTKQKNGSSLSIV